MGAISRARGLLRTVRSRSAVNYTRREMFDGVSVDIPSIRGIRCRPTEQWMHDVLRTVLPVSPGVFLDVGANIGQSLVKLKTIEPSRAYLGFEPNPACNFYIDELIQANDFVDCAVLPVGVGLSDGVLELARYGSSVDSGASLVPNFRPERPVKSWAYVPVMCFETLAAIIGRRPVGVVKIDVEGAESDVIESFKPLFDKDRPFILLEVLPAYSDAYTDRIARQQRIEAVLAEVGYVLHRIRKNEAGRLAGFDPIETIGIHSDLNACDYLALPRERAADFPG